METSNLERMLKLRKKLSVFIETLKIETSSNMGENVEIKGEIWLWFKGEIEEGLSLGEDGNG